MLEYLIKFRSSFMKEGDWSASMVWADNIIDARTEFFARVARDWGQNMVLHVGIISIDPPPEGGW